MRIRGSPPVAEERQLLMREALTTTLAAMSAQQTVNAIQQIL
jgi:hypothetical protein